MKILVTGSKGFIARNLIKHFKENFIVEIIEFDKKQNLKILEKLTKGVDFIFHLAGEARPSRKKEEYEKSNSVLTEKLIEAILKNEEKIPIAFTSSIHADTSVNDYGRTKKESELIIEKYAIDFKIPCFIYKLPHIFGEGCKPYHHSVITTWIFNRVNNLESTIYDRSQKMNYVYVQDLVKDLAECLKKNKFSPDTLYHDTKIIYPTTLGEVFDYIEEFNEMTKDKSYQIKEDGFKKKLFNVYKTYT